MDFTPLYQFASLALSNGMTYHLALRKGRHQERKVDRDAEKEARDALWIQLKQQVADLSASLKEAKEGAGLVERRLRRHIRKLSARTEELEDVVANLGRENQQLRHQQQNADEVIEQLQTHVSMLQRQVKELGAEPAPPPKKETTRKRGTTK